MPKKKKSQKIIADLRRKLKAQKEKRTYSKAKTAPKKSKKTPPKSEPKTEKQVSPHILNDLKKSFILTGLAIGLELVLYYILKQ